MRVLLSIIFICLTQAVLLAQSLQDLQQKKQATVNQIQYTSKLIKKSEQNSKVSLNKLSLLRLQTQLRNKLISNINAEIKALDQSMDEHTFEINALTKDLSSLKAEYAQMIQFAYKNQTAYHKLLFFLSAENFNQGYKRMIYLRNYTEYRQKQARKIIAATNTLHTKKALLEEKKQAKERLLSEARQERHKLEEQRQKEHTYLTLLQQKQENLKRKLVQYKIEQAELEKEIQRVLEEEARKREKAGIKLTPEQQLISDSFAKNKGRLPWPVEQGVISEKFGIHPHPVMKNVQIRNNGIDINTNKGSKARAIFKGTVSKVIGISGGNMAVIIRHGNYISVYSNLQEVHINTGEMIDAKQDIGIIFTDETDNNQTILKFQIWNEHVKLDPEDWIAK
jgi:septal ring factor EnvC (AmiA/AmiB activator)